MELVVLQITVLTGVEHGQDRWVSPVFGICWRERLPGQQPPPLLLQSHQLLPAPHGGGQPVKSSTDHNQISILPGRGRRKIYLSIDDNHSYSGDTLVLEVRNIIRTE